MKGRGTSSWLKQIVEESEIKAQQVLQTYEFKKAKKESLSALYEGNLDKVKQPITDQPDLLFYPSHSATASPLLNHWKAHLKALFAEFPFLSISERPAHGKTLVLTDVTDPLQNHDRQANLMKQLDNLCASLEQIEYRFQDSNIILFARDPNAILSLAELADEIGRLSEENREKAYALPHMVKKFYPEYFMPKSVSDSEREVKQPLQSAGQSNEFKTTFDMMQLFEDDMTTSRMVHRTMNIPAVFPELKEGQKPCWKTCLRELFTHYPFLTLLERFSEGIVLLQMVAIEDPLLKDEVFTKLIKRLEFSLPPEIEKTFFIYRVGFHCGKTPEAISMLAELADEIERLSKEARAVKKEAETCLREIGVIPDLVNICSEYFMLKF